VPDPKPVLLIRSTGYIATNEYLIASVRGHRLESVECAPDIETGRGRRRSWASFDANRGVVLPGRSSFHFDLDDDRRRLEELLSSLEDEGSAGLPCLRPDRWMGRIDR
jgi:hypothetical protein